MEKRCGTCKWALMADESGFAICQYPLPLWVHRELLNPLTGGGGLADTIKADVIHQCPTWEARDE